MTLQKRLFDVFFSLLLMVVLGPVILVLVIWLYLKQGRPLFYVAERMKTPEQAFGLVKFRTMTVVAHDQGVSGAHKASRVTPMGKRLRAKRLDEFPQLWNILKGDLSFVGPRPPLREYVQRFPDVYGPVLRSRPGVTGLATIRFHKHEERLLLRCVSAAQTDDVYSRICVPRKAKLDLIYQRHQSICYDFSIVFQTIANLFQRPKE
jgi:lipopolysaccharide/colanic/teichoic acid biosynthesis glycosyltransferase